MFTGIIEEIGKILTISSNSVEIEAKEVLQGTQIGDSISVNGVCLTVSDINKKSFSANISPETFKVTSFSNLKSGMAVNLERALSVNGRFGGHIVSGHVDGTGKIVNIKKQNDFYTLSIELTKSQTKYAVQKGSIAVNGISLTIANIVGNILEIAIIPHTYDNTILKTLEIGDSVNIETDILAKYIEKFLLTSDNGSGISMEFLMKNGF